MTVVTLSRRERLAATLLVCLLSPWPQPPLREREEMAAAGDDVWGEPRPWVEGATRPRRHTVVSASANQTSKFFECGRLSDYVESTHVGLHSTRTPPRKLPCGSTCHARRSLILRHRFSLVLQVEISIPQSK